jgi:hypothetical protein
MILRILPNICHCPNILFFKFSHNIGGTVVAFILCEKNF